MRCNQNKNILIEWMRLFRCKMLIVDSKRKKVIFQPMLYALTFLIDITIKLLSYLILLRAFNMNHVYELVIKQKKK